MLKHPRGEACDNGADDCHSAPCYEYTLEALASSRATTVPLKNYCTSFADKSGVRSELPLCLHRRQFR